MSSSTDNKLFWMLIDGISFLYAVGVGALYFPAVANHEPLLHAWRIITAMLAIIFIKRLVDVLPRVRWCRCEIWNDVRALGAGFQSDAGCDRIVLVLAIHATKRLSAFLTPDRQEIIDFSAADFAFNSCHLLSLTYQWSFLNSEAAATPLGVWGGGPFLRGCDMNYVTSKAFTIGNVHYPIGVYCSDEGFLAFCDCHKCHAQHEVAAVCRQTNCHSAVRRTGPPASC